MDNTNAPSAVELWTTPRGPQSVRDNHLCFSDFFDTERFPTITLVSKRIGQRLGDRFRVVGDLTMHRDTLEVERDRARLAGDPRGWSGCDLADVGVDAIRPDP